LILNNMQLGKPSDYRVDIDQETIWIKNENTTIAYCRFTNHGDIEYIYVQPMYRLMGFGRMLVNTVRQVTGVVGLPQEPVSPMGQRFFAALHRNPL